MSGAHREHVWHGVRPLGDGRSLRGQAVLPCMPSPLRVALADGSPAHKAAGSPGCPEGLHQFRHPPRPRRCRWALHPSPTLRVPRFRPPQGGPGARLAPRHGPDGKTGYIGIPRVQKEFEKLQEGKEKKSYVLPYFMSGHPGCTVPDMVALAEFMRDHRLRTEQVQDFTPTPMTISTCMYHTGLDPFSLEPVHVPRGQEKKVQRALLQYWTRGTGPSSAKGSSQQGGPTSSARGRTA